MNERLQKILSQAGVASRRASEKLIADKFIGIWEPHVWIAGR